MEAFLFVIAIALVLMMPSVWMISVSLRRIAIALEKQNDIPSPEHTEDPDPFHGM